jgi:hypothetical protein
MEGSRTEAPGKTFTSPEVEATRSAGRQRRPITARQHRADVANERRTVRKIRFTAAEWTVVEERARARGRAPARYVREVTLGAVPKVSRTRANAPIIRELGALAVALQRVNRVLKQPGEGEASDARRDGETGRAAAQTSATEDIDAAVGGLLAIVRRLG